MFPVALTLFSALNRGVEREQIRRNSKQSPVQGGRRGRREGVCGFPWEGVWRHRCEGRRRRLAIEREKGGKKRRQETFTTLATKVKTPALGAPRGEPRVCVGSRESIDGYPARIGRFRPLNHAGIPRTHEPHPAENEYGDRERRALRRCAVTTIRGAAQCLWASAPEKNRDAPACPKPSRLRKEVSNASALKNPRAGHVAGPGAGLRSSRVPP